MNRLSALYPAGSVNEKRIQTDTLFSDEQAHFAFRGILDETARYLEAFQLLSPAHWTRFVDQFRLHSDDGDDGWRGEYWGKMMRGACFVYSYSKNPALFETLRSSVEDMLTSADDSGRITSYSAHEFSGWDLWCRKYVMLGMQYFMEINPDEELNKRLIASMRKQADYLIAHFGEGKLNITETTIFWRGLASSSILEPIVRLYDLTGEQKYLDFAEYIVSCGGTSIANVFALALEDKTDPYQYPITKAYELISCFEGLLELYRATGNEEYKKAVVAFAHRLGKTDITIIGSAGCTHEMLDHAAARQTDTAYRGLMQETCVTVTWMKFCMQLLLLTGEEVFAGYFERALYNAYLGSVNTEKIADAAFVHDRFPDAIVEPMPFDSYSPLLSGTRGRGIGGLKLMPDQHYYGCCACIGAAGIGMAHKVAVLLSRTGITVSLYVPGTVSICSPNGQTLRLDTETDYPACGSVKMTLHLPQAEAFALSLRIPSWSAQTKLRINGMPVPAEAAGVYQTLTRAWQDGDTVELELDMRTRLLRPVSNPKDVIFVTPVWQHNYLPPKVVYESPDAPFHAALERGPLVLARDARLGGSVDEKVDIAADADGFVDLSPADAFAAHQVAFSVPQTSGSRFLVIDYASAGKTWDESSRFACWLPTKTK